MEVSQLKFYSVGVVAANKPLTSMEIEVTPMEDLPFVDGEITDKASKYKASATDKEGKAYSTEIDTTVSVKAKWLPLGQSNRMTSPDVRRGEVVMLYRFADTDKFYWTSLQNDTKLRKLETVIYAFSATVTEDEKGGADNMYWLEVSTHHKLIHFHTSKANGEPFAYDIQINTKDGCIVIKDDVGNLISFDSKEHRIEIINQDGSFVDVNKTKIFLKSTDLIQMDTKAVIINAETVDENSTTRTVKTTNLNETSTTHTVKATDMKITAKVDLTGTMNSSGNIKSAADVQAGSISLSQHTHKDADSSGDVGPPK